VFSQEIIQKFRMQKGYGMLYSIQNEVPAEKFDKRRKKRRVN
jgi:hypothetical protein